MALTPLTLTLTPLTLTLTALTLTPLTLRRSTSLSLSPLTSPY